MNESRKLTQEEAEHLLKMVKKALISELAFPEKGTSVEFDVEGDEKKDLFTTKIYRGKINHMKYQIGARIKKDGITLLELHINPGNTHINPDGAKIVGSHWHIYSEKYGRRQAVQAEDIQSDHFIENTLLFMKKFNIVKMPSINYQLELI